MMLLSFFDSGLDEMAAGARASTAPRLAATLAVALVALAFLPWPACAAWFVAATAVDLTSWAITREQALGRPVSLGARLQYVACLVVVMIMWVLLGVLLWATGSAAGALCGAVIWMAIMGFAQAYAYQSRAGYVLAGVIPAAAMLVTPVAIPNRAIAHIAPVWLLMLAGVAFGVSSARQIMAARRRYEQATQDLRESEQSYRLLADNVTDVISLASADHQRLYVSPSIERVLRFSPGELMATPSYTYLHPDDAARVNASIDATTVESGPKTIDYRVFTKDGEVIWAETTFSRLNDGSGRLLAVSRDGLGPQAAGSRAEGRAGPLRGRRRHQDRLPGQHDA